MNETAVVQCLEQGIQHDLALSAAEAKRAWHELERFLLVASSSTGRQAPSPPLDQIWHSALLRPKAYNEYCENRLGRRVQHLPGVVPISVYEQSRNAVLAQFGYVDSRYWPHPESLENKFLDCEVHEGDPS